MGRLIAIVIIFGLFVGSFLPAKEGLSPFQKLGQFLVNRLDPNWHELVTQKDIDVMEKQDLMCKKNTDCVLVMCGKRPNESSFAVNKYTRLNASHECGQEGKAWWDSYTKCDEGVCVFKRMIVRW